LGERFGKEINSRADLTVSFTAGKFTPSLGAVYKKLDESKGREADNEELITNLTVPMWMQDLKEVYKDDPATVGMFMNFMAMLGAQTRVVDESKRPKREAFKIYQKGKYATQSRESTEAEGKQVEEDVPKIFEDNLKKAKNNTGWGYNQFKEMTISDDEIKTRGDYNKLSDEQKVDLEKRLKTSAKQQARNKIKF
jgi:hypothetical protein